MTLPFGVFGEPFYAERIALDNPDPLDTRPGGTKVTDATLKRLVTTVQPTNVSVPIHARKLRQTEVKVHEGMVYIEAHPEDEDNGRSLADWIRAKHALSQEITTALVVPLQSELEIVLAYGRPPASA